MAAGWGALFGVVILIGVVSFKVFTLPEHKDYVKKSELGDPNLYRLACDEMLRQAKAANLTFTGCDPVKISVKSRDRSDVYVTVHLAESSKPLKIVVHLWRNVWSVKSAESA